jgi:hypothetical protein
MRSSTSANYRPPQIVSSNKPKRAFDATTASQSVVLLQVASSLIHSLFARTILHLAYGLKDDKAIDELTAMAEENIRGHTAVLIPGRYLVNTIPALRFVPSWFPGAGWRKEFDDLAEKTEEMTMKPFEGARQRMVGRVTFLAEHWLTFLLLQIDGVQGDYPSLVNQLLDRLPSKDDPEYDARTAVAKNVAAIAYVGEPYLPLLAFFH